MVSGSDGTGAASTLSKSCPALVTAGGGPFCPRASIDKTRIAIGNLTACPSPIGMQKTYHNIRYNRQFHPMPSPCEDRSEARSMVISQHGIVATSQTLASQAGAQILARGGSAMDAAIAANVVLGVVEPMSNGIGGDLFAIHWDATTGKLTGLNASGWAPANHTLAALAAKGFDRMPQDGIHSVTAPGCVAGWQKLHEKFCR